MRLSCLRTNNELSLGELVHPKCIHFSKYFSHRFSLESHHTWIKLLNLMLFWAKVFFLYLFAWNKIGKTTTQVFHYDKYIGLCNIMRRATRLKREQVARPKVGPTPPMPVQTSDSPHRLLLRTPLYTPKTYPPRST
jgi:hypothetical protein